MKWLSLPRAALIALLAMAFIHEHAGAATVAAGYMHSCEVTPAGAARCWGDNSFGQLGTGNTGSTLAPVQVSGLMSGVAAISAGGYHTCVLTTAGGVKCWGMNVIGQLGTGTMTDSLVPIDVPGLTSGVSAISAGFEHTCAVLTTGSVECWGANFYGQLGDGTTNTQLSPVIVPGISATQIAGGYGHTCAATTTGTVMCWGWNLYGQLGNGGNANSSSPGAVSGIASGATGVASGWLHSCAIVAGGVQCWGFDGYGELGDGGNTWSYAPVTAVGVANVSTVSAGLATTCVTTTADAKCWGFGSYGTLGNNTFAATSSTAVTVVSPGGIAGSLSVGAFHACATWGANSVACWGYNGGGQLGDLDTVNSPIPVLLAPLAPYAVVNGGNSQTTPINTAFALPLSVAVTDELTGAPVQGGTVTFTLPAAGASGTFAGGVRTASVVTNASGIAAAPAITANDLVGTISVRARSAGSAEALFTLTTTRGAQGVTFGTIANQRLATATMQISASASSSLMIGFTSLTPGVCTVTGPVNVGLAANGGVASVSSLIGVSYPGSAVNNGDRTGAPYGNGGTWYSNGPVPQWAEIDFSSAASISEVDVFSMQDDPSAPYEPTPALTFNTAGISAFDVQYWDGAQWLNVPNGSITGNTLVWRRVSFAPVSTSRIRVNVNATPNYYVALTEVEAWTAATGPGTAGTVTFTGTGTCTIRAAQSGNANYLAAANVDRSFIVSGPDAQLAFVQQPTNANAGAILSPAPTVSILDAAGSPTPSTANVTLALASNPGNATLSGTLTVAAVNGVATFSDITVSNTGTGYTLTVSSASVPTTTSASFNINAAPVFTSAAPPNATYGVTYSYGVTASGAPVPTFSVTSGALPAGLALNGTTGQISGIASMPGSYSGVITASNGIAPDVSQAFNIVVAQATQTINFAPLGDHMLGSPPFAVSASATSGLIVSFASQTPATCTVTGTSVSLVAAGACTVRATQAGNADYAAAAAVDRTFNATAFTQAPAITSAPPPGASVGAAYSHYVTASGTPGPTFAITAGALPAGVTLNATTGAIAGTPASVGTFAGTITATNGIAPDATQAFSIVVNASVPGAPVIGIATAGNAQATIAFSAPAFTGGAPINAYAVTCMPGSVSASGAASPLNVTGLANGTTYSCSVRATNAAGTGAISGTVSVTPAAPSVTTYSGSTTTGTGIASLAMNGGGSACTLASAAFVQPPAATPVSLAFPDGFVQFTATGCTPGAKVDFTLTLPRAIPAGAAYWKYGATPGNATPHWYSFPVTISGKTVTFSIVDGAMGDDDLTANGRISDPGGVAVAAAVIVDPAAAIPTLGDYAVIALGMILATLGSFASRLRAARP